MTKNSEINVKSHIKKKAEASIKDFSLEESLSEIQQEIVISFKLAPFDVFVPYPSLKNE